MTDRVEADSRPEVPLPSRSSPETRLAWPVPPRMTDRVDEADHTPSLIAAMPFQALEFWPVPPEATPRALFKVVVFQKYCSELVAHSQEIEVELIDPTGKLALVLTVSVSNSPLVACS